jgi:hypothetical protein
VAPAFPKAGRSGIATSVFDPPPGTEPGGTGGLDLAPPALAPVAVWLAAAVALVDPAAGGVDANAAFAAPGAGGLGRIDTVASGAGCGGSPAAIRWRGGDASAVSRPGAGSAGFGAGAADAGLGG